jgi:hypothetical protein
MRENGFNEPMRGNSPYMVYQAIHFDVSEKYFSTTENTSLLQTIKDRIIKKDKLNTSPSRTSDK